jgi:hypothetical protein
MSGILDDALSDGPKRSASPLRVVLYIAVALIGFLLYTVDGKLNAAVAGGNTIVAQLSEHIKESTEHQARMEQYLRATNYLAMRICLNGSRNHDERIACLEK